MCRILLLAVLPAVGLSCALFAQEPSGAQTQPAAPRIVLSQDSWNFGEVWHPESPKMTLVVRNEGSANLKLTNVKSTCGCTVVQPARNVIPPGESTDIQVRFDTQGKQDDVHSKVIIESNDPQRAKIEFNIAGKVKRVVKRDPLGGLVIRSLDPSPGQTGTIRLTNQTNETMQLRLLSKNVPEMAIEIQEVTPGVEYLVTGRSTQTLRPGITRGTAVFATGLKREEKLSIPLRIQIMSLVAPVPAACLLDPDTNPKPGERTVAIQYYGDLKPFQVTGYKSSDPRITVALGPTVPASHGLEKLNPPVKAVVQAQVSVPAAHDMTGEGAIVEFMTNEPNCPKVEVLITADRAAWEARMYGPPEGPQQNEP